MSHSRSTSCRVRDKLIGRSMAQSLAPPTCMLKANILNTGVHLCECVNVGLKVLRHRKKHVWIGEQVCVDEACSEKAVGVEKRSVSTNPCNTHLVFQ